MTEASRSGLGPTQRSLWDKTAVPGPDLPTLAGPIEAEVAIVGGGYAGLSTALHLAERGIATVLLEASAPGAGASGRNGGQVIPGLRHFCEDLTAVYGEELGRRLHAWGASTADTAFGLIERHGLRCDAQRSGWINAASGEVETALVRRRAAAWGATGAPVRMLDRSEFAALTGSRAYETGLIDMRGGSVQPLSLARELARVAQAAGASIFARSPATGIVRDGTGWSVTTPEGRVSARRLLLATNAMAGPVWPRLAEAFLPVWSFQVATDPLAAGHGVLPTGAVVSDMRRVLRYFRRDRDGRLVVGGKGTIGAPRGPSSFGGPRRMLARLYPDLPDRTPAYYWGGQVAVTLDRLPRLVTLDEGVFATLACNGKGVAWNVALGPVLADALTGADPRSLPLPPARPLDPIPFHGLKKVYAAAGSAWLRLQDVLDVNTSRAA